MYIPYSKILTRYAKKVKGLKPEFKVIQFWVSPAKKVVQTLLLRAKLARKVEKFRANSAKFVAKEINLLFLRKIGIISEGVSFYL